MNSPTRKLAAIGFGLAALAYGGSQLTVLQTTIDAQPDGATYPFQMIKDPDHSFGDPALVTPWSSWGLVGIPSRPIWKVYADDITETSDERVKENIEDLNGSEVLRKIQRLRAVSYKKKEISGRKTDEREIGFLAQDVKRQFPEIVSYHEKSDSYGIKYSRAIPILLKAIQEQQKQIEKQAAQIEALQKASSK